jgi:RNA polymerase sigma-70 factor (ECF subfamily)
MRKSSEINSQILQAAAERLLIKATRKWDLSADDLTERIALAAEKYLQAKAYSKSDLMNLVEQLYADDLCLVIACEKGNEDAWQYLIDNYTSVIKRAASAASDESRGGEIAELVWAELYGLRLDKEGKTKGKLAYYTGKGPLGGWLRAVAAQLAVDDYRKNFRNVQIAEDGDNAFEQEAKQGFTVRASSLESGNENHADLVEDIEIAQKILNELRSAISKLSAEDRLLIKLYFLDGANLKEIGKTFGFHEATASRRLSRLLDELKGMVKKSLKSQQGWSESEVESGIEKASQIPDFDLEKLLSGLIAVAVLQVLLW